MTATDAARPIAVLVNPDAGAAGGAYGQTLAAVVDEKGYARTVATRDQLADFAREARERDVRAVAVCGGDGTLGRVATAVAAEYRDSGMPPLAPLGGGTMNTIARSLGMMRPQPEPLLRSLISGAGSRRRQGSIRVNGDRVGMLIGAGVPARFLALYEEGAVLGAGRAVAVLLPLVGSALVGGGQAAELFQAAGCRARVDDDPLAIRRASLVYAATVDDIGLGFRPTPRAREVEGRFQCLLGDLQPTDLVRALPAIWRGRGVSGEAWIDRCASRLRVEFDEPTVYMIDGDVEGSVDTLEMTSGPVFDLIIG